jgi:putative spermidine/putrescine transport system ATP-binding protein
MMRDTVLEIRDLWHSYGDIQAIRGVSLTLGRGEFVSLLGPSGSGKSTMLMVLAGFEQASRGVIELLGRDIARLPPERRGMGVVLSTIDNIQYPLRMRGVNGSEARRAAEEVLDLVEMREYAMAMPQQLSGGQQQRVALARALVFKPPVLLMDEPLSALDRRLRQNMQFELRRLQRAIGATVLYVTHDQEEALVMSDRIAVLNAGQLVQAGSPQDVYDEPATSFVAEFLGEANLAEVEAVEAPGPIAIAAGSDGEPAGDVPAPDPPDPGVAAYRLLSGDGIVVRARSGPRRGLLVVRPERLRIGPVGQSASDAAVHGRVESVYFLGDQVRLEVEVGLGRRWKVVLSAGSPELEWVRDGADVSVAWRGVDARVVD